MIRITVEILPHGDVEQSRVLGMIHVANVGTTTEDIGTYRIWDGLAGEDLFTTTGHKRGDGWRPLVARVMTMVARHCR